jgi:hypothetical protein
MEMKMGKELNAGLETVNEVVEAQINDQIIKLDELSLAYIGGGEALVNI